MGWLLSVVAVVLIGAGAAVVALPVLLPPPGLVAAAPEQVGAGAVAGRSVVIPIPPPGWVRRIPVPVWPPDLAAHMDPSAVTNQCVAGALATWAAVHAGDPRWNRPPPLLGNAIDLYRIATGEGFQVGRMPVAGAMVVYGAAYGLFGHVATVLAVEADRYEVVEQNFLDFSPDVQLHWRTFDVRSIAWPDPAVVGFIDSPP